MNLAMVERRCTVGNRAGGVERLECSPLVRSGEPPRSADVEGNPVTTEDDGDDLGLAGQPANGGDRQIAAEDGAGRGVGVMSVGE